MSSAPASGVASRCSGLATALAVALGAGALTQSALAASVDVTSITVLHGRPEYRDGRNVLSMPVVELFGLRAFGVDNPIAEDVQLVVSAWGELQTRDAATGAVDADVDLAMAEGKLFRKTLRLRVGRQLVTGGSARIMPLDGGSAEVAIPGGFALLAWGGVPVTPRFAVQQGDAAAGGRFSWRPFFETEIGASYAFVLDEGLRAREDAGIDARWTPVPALTLSGFAVWSVVENRLAELDVGPRWRLLPQLELTLAARRTAPDLLLPRNSILSVFSETMRDELLGSLWWRASPRISVFADLRALRVAGDPGTDSGAGLSVGIGTSARTVASAQVRLLRLSEMGYLRGRAALSHRLPSRLVLAIDAEAVRLDPPINGTRQSINTAASASYPIGDDWIATLNVAGGTDPLWRERVEVLAKLAYRFQTRVRDGSRR